MWLDTDVSPLRVLTREMRAAAFRSGVKHADPSHPAHREYHEKLGRLMDAYEERGL